MNDRLKQDEEKRGRLILWGGVALAFALRAAYVAAVKILPYNDAGQWDTARLSILNGLPYTVSWPPFYPALLALVTKIFGEGYVPLNLFNAVLSALTCLVIYLCAKEAFDKKTARLALLFSAVYVDLVWYCGVMMSENLAVLLFTLMVYSVLKKKHPAVHGLLFGLACLAKGFFIFAAPALVFWLYYRHKDEGWLKKAVLAGVFTFLTLVPWTIRNTLFYKDVVPLEPSFGCSLFDGHNPYATGGVDYSFINYEYGKFYEDKSLSMTERDRICLKKAVEFIVHNPLREVQLTLLKFSKMVTFSTSFVFYRAEYPARKAMFILAMFENMALFPLCILGIAFSFRDKNAAGFAAVIAVFLAVFSTLFSADGRKRLPFLPLLLILAAYGAAILPGIIERVRKGETGEVRRKFMVTAVLSGLLFLNLIFQVSTRYRDVLQRFQ